MTVEYWYPTPIYYNQISESDFFLVQNELENAFHYIKNQKGFNKRDGWSTDTHYLTGTSFQQNIIEDLNLVHFRRVLLLHIKEYLTEINIPSNKIKDFKISESWMTLSLRGDRADTHSHGCHDVSGVYYIKSNTKDGKLYFESPVKQMQSSYLFEQPSRVMFEPRIGKIILFPSWLEHGVYQNTTEEERVSLSFNIDFKRF